MPSLKFFAYYPCIVLFAIAMCSIQGFKVIHNDYKRFSFRLLAEQRKSACKLTSSGIIKIEGNEGNEGNEDNEDTLTSLPLEFTSKDSNNELIEATSSSKIGTIHVDHFIVRTSMYVRDKSTS
jgi:hypothetical protein